MNKTVPESASRNTSLIMCVCVALVILILLLGDAWYHLAVVRSRPADSATASAQLVAQLESDAATRSNELAELRAGIARIQTNRDAAAYAADAKRDKEMAELRATLGASRVRFEEAGAALELRAKEIELGRKEAEGARKATRQKDEEIERLRKRIDNLAREMSNAAARTLPVAPPDNEPGESREPVPPSLPSPPEARVAPAPPVRWLDAPGWPGMCRGLLHLVSAPFVVPCAVASGVGAPWTGSGGTNDADTVAGASVAMPFTVAVGSLAGAGGCVNDALSGTADICSFGYYGVRRKEFTGEIDDRPTVVQLLDRDEATHVVTVEDDQTMPPPPGRTQKRMMFPVR